MSSLSRRFRRLLPRALKRRLAEREAATKSSKHLDAGQAAAALGVVDGEWRKRIDDVVRCADNAFIPRVAGAGELKGGTIVMHNGIQVGALGYYGGGILNMLVENKGVHEPQEERAFAEVLKAIPAGGTMVELGAYWGFYSMWFLREVEQGKAYLIEPDAQHILSGRQNFEINGLTGHFESAYAGKRVGVAKDGTTVTTLDDFMSRQGLERLAILHADIQGAELDMLEGGRRTLEAGKVDYVFISTHSNELHEDCVARLRAFGFTILASCNLERTVAVDGVIVAKRRGVAGPDFLEMEGNAVAPPSSGARH